MFKDDMVCDGIENCVQYINNFNPEKSKNPFETTLHKLYIMGFFVEYKKKRNN